MAGVMGRICIECGKSLANQRGFVRNMGYGLICSDCHARIENSQVCPHCGVEYKEFHMCRDTQETLD
jgi:rRNA maturation endonuclease Nob1